MCGLRAVYHLQACCSRSNFGAWMVQIPHIFGHAAILKQSSQLHRRAPHTWCAKIHLRCTEDRLRLLRSAWIGSIVPEPPCDESPMQTRHTGQNACVSGICSSLVPSLLPFNLMVTLIKIMQDSPCLVPIKTLVFTAQRLFWEGANETGAAMSRFGPRREMSRRPAAWSPLRGI